MLSTSELEAVIRTLQEVLKMPGWSYDRVADATRLSSSNLKRYVQGGIARPREDSVTALVNFIAKQFSKDQFSKVVQSDYEIVERLLDIASPEKRFTPSIRHLFPFIDHPATPEVPQHYISKFVIYRNAGLQKDAIVRALLEIHGDRTMPEFEISYFDSLRNPVKIYGYAMSSRHVINLIGHVSTTTMVRLVVMEKKLNVDNPIRGLTLTNDFRENCFASRFVALRTIAHIPSEDLGRFSITDLQKTGFKEEYDCIRDYLSNATTENNVLFLNPEERTLDVGD